MRSTAIAAGTAATVAAITLGAALAIAPARTSRHATSDTQVIPAGSAMTAAATQSFPGVGARLAPPPHRALTVMAHADVLARTSAFPLVAQLARDKQPSSMILGTYENLFGTKHASGKETPSVPAQLAWFVQYDVSSLPAFGLPQQYAHSPAPTKQPPKGYSCQIFIATNATTGKVIDAFDHCGTHPFATTTH